MAVLSSLFFYKRCFFSGLYFAYKRFLSDKKKSGDAEDIAKLEKAAIMKQMERDQVEIKKKKVEYEHEMAKKKMIETETEGVILANEKKRIELQGFSPKSQYSRSSSAAPVSFASATSALTRANSEYLTTAQWEWQESAVWKSYSAESNKKVVWFC